MKYLLSTLLLAALFIIVIPKAVHAETLDEYLNNLATPKEKYNTMLSSSYLKTNSSEESIDPQTGELSYSQTDCVLPGRNGFDLEIKRIYKSNAAIVGDMKIETYSYTYAIFSILNTKSYYEKTYNIGTGFRFSFPSIEIKTNSSDGYSYKFLHTENGDTYRLAGPRYVNGVNRYYLENHPVNDLEIYEQQVSLTRDGVSLGTSAIIMKEKNGVTSYFDACGRILDKKDRYGNEISFEYSDLVVIWEGTTNTYKLISKITDSIGRVINIEYNEGDKNADGSFSMTNVSFSPSSPSKGEIILYLPDYTQDNNKKIRYLRSNSTIMSSDAPDGYYCTLDRVIDVNNIEKTIYCNYMDFISYGSELNKYVFLNLSNGCYPVLEWIVDRKSNRATKYSYGYYTKSYLGYKMLHKKVTNKAILKRTTGTGHDGDFIVSNYETVNSEAIQYTNGPDGTTIGFHDSTNINDDWNVISGVWTSVSGDHGFSTNANGDNRVVSKSSDYSNFIFESSIYYTNPGTDAYYGLSFRTNHPSQSFNGYEVRINYAYGSITLGKYINGVFNVMNTAYYALTPGKTYPLKVVANNGYITVYLSDMGSPKINTSDSMYKQGYIGMHSHNVSATFGFTYASRILSFSDNFDANPSGSGN